MKAGVIIGTIIVIILLIAGGALAFMKLGKSQNSATTANPQAAAPSKSSTFSSIQDIFSNKSLSLSCSFTDENGRNTVTYIKNGSVRANVTGKTAAENGSILVKSNIMYFWNGAQGMMIKYDPSQMQKAMSGNAQTAQGQAALSNLDKYKESCKPAVIDDSLFTPPGDVKFQDISAMMKLIPSGSAPSGGTVPSINPSQYQQMME